jgi:RimJ/RimL family protein N-acetyltransferase
VYPSSLSSILDEILGDNLIKKEPEDMKCTLEECKKILEYQRINFQFYKSKYESLKENFNRNELINSNHYKIVPISESIFDQLREGVAPKFFWNNYEEFNQFGIGFTLLSESGNPASTAFASFTNKEELEIGIETIMEYYGQGFATLVCSQLIDYCIEKDIIPVWSCNSTNLGSRALAKKLGFVETKRIPYYYLIEE